MYILPNASNRTYCLVHFIIISSGKTKFSMVSCVQCPVYFQFPNQDKNATATFFSLHVRQLRTHPCLNKLIPTTEEQHLPQLQVKPVFTFVFQVFRYVFCFYQKSELKDNCFDFQLDVTNYKCYESFLCRFDNRWR